jgi:tripartite-type tricarboxylate transporter receptor subunit TctC
VKYLAVAGARRLPDMPEVPTLAEAGGPANVEASGFVALLVPRETPVALCDRINKDLLAAVASPEVQARLKTFSFETAPRTPAQTRRAIEARTVIYGQVVTGSNIKLD